MLNLEQAEHILARADCLYSADDVDKAVERIAKRIAGDYAGKNPLVLCVLKGGVFAATALLQRLQFPLEFDCIQVTRYRNTTTGGNLDWRIRPDTPLAGRHVLIIDDILDEGVTLEAIIEECTAADAISVEVAVLARKHHDRVIENAAHVKYIALELPDRYVFGCGMDYKGYFRNFNAIYALNPD